jgi:serpin B
MNRQAHTGPDGHDPGTRDLVWGNNSFALDLYAQIRFGRNNLFLSPYSLSLVLAMAYAGARRETARQMAQALHFTEDQEQLHLGFTALEAVFLRVQAGDDVQLSAANSLWPRVGHDLVHDYVALLIACYGGLVKPLDYDNPEAARRTINRWVEDRTGGRIQNLIRQGDLSALTLLVLASAIYFKGDWASQFDPALTRDAPFWVDADEAVTVPMMSQTQTFRWARWPELQVLELPYEGKDLSMIVLLPARRNGLVQLEAALTLENLEMWISQLRDVQVQVQLPRFRLDYRFEVNGSLRALGMTNAFSWSTANFRGMIGLDRGFCIDLVIHQAFVQVDEAGTEAAAATVTLSRSAPPVFRADHAFLFLIRENVSGSILFMGRVVDPTGP